MTSLRMMEIRPNLRALLTFLDGRGLVTRRGNEDFGYGLHAWLKDAFGEMAPKPWRLFMDRRRPPRVLGYCQNDAESLQQRIEEFADPTSHAVCSHTENAIASRLMPSWQPGRRLGFEIQCCPVGRQARTGVEKDLFLLRADRAGQDTVDRSEVYCDWVRKRLERDGAAEVRTVHLGGFRLVRMLRLKQRRSGHRRHRYLTRPQALLRGEITVHDPEAFTELLAHGVGRHRAFGYGMLLLRPPS